ncbi:hypothetical protein [Silvimonas iriomotensis]|uniref:Transmembrane protein n=1 Tax=Silvimonas iriomotensis TaxID=449662 RepID=A0ABQ2PF26_9NEIS|nr:hypothetical protein [Silvimonas iriomotensis]GGP24163.1 hypothetical protein GCM10010970_41630 [Silvimonas iriomotensis]
MSARPLQRRWWVLPFALLLALQSWLWLHLRRGAEWLLAWPVWRRWGAGVMRWLRARTPFQAMLCFIVPVLLTNPPRLICVYLLAKGHWLASAVLYVTLKSLEFGSVAVVERACRPVLRTVRLYRRGYLFVARWRRWTRRQLRPWRQWWRLRCARL